MSTNIFKPPVLLHVTICRVNDRTPPEIKTPAEIGAMIAELRVRKTGLSRRALAERARINRQKINDIENGRIYPDLDELQRILFECDATFAQIFGEGLRGYRYSQRYKKHHEDLEFVLSKLGPTRSATIIVLKRECELLELQAESRASPRPKQRAGQDGTDGDAEETATR